MTEAQEILWKKIKEFEIDEPLSALTFTERLTRENGWSIQFTLRTVEEYKKFMFLICLAEHPLTPSDQIDQVWHLHLLYTQSYWNDFCKNTLNRNIHHGPTKGGVDENTKYTNWYEKTKELYQTIFESVPPEDIWEPSHIRFRENNFQRVNLNQNWIIKKPSIFKK